MGFKEPSLLAGFSALLMLAACDNNNSSQEHDANNAKVAESVKSVPVKREEIVLSFAPVVKKVSPAVVNIFAESEAIVEDSKEGSFLDDPFFQQFVKKRNLLTLKPQQSLGSGVIVSPDGIIITNYHVIKPGTEIKVVMYDKKEYTAKVLGIDKQTDLAALKIESDRTDFVFLPLDSDKNLEVGDLVLAIGNPFGVGQSVSSGIISAMSRGQLGISRLRSFIQTDAAVNPGNSGGALVTVDGRLIGFNTAIYSKTGGSIGIGFATPAILAAPLLKSAKDGSPIERPWSGLELEALTADTAEALGLDTPDGAIVKTVYPNGPGEKAGIQAGDLIRTINGSKIDDDADFDFEIAVLPVGSTAQIVILRKDRVMMLPFLLEAPESNADAQKITQKSPFEGAYVQVLSPALAFENGLNPSIAGLIISEIEPGSKVDQLKFNVGDIIMKVNDKDVQNVDELIKELASSDNQWKIVIRRENSIITMKIHAKTDS